MAFFYNIGINWVLEGLAVAILLKIEESRAMRRKYYAGIFK
jgi:hypothetical protein